jgi:hypothetical protein
VNGHDIGRYWLLPRNDGSGVPSQRFYHVPPDWLAEAGALNELVLFEDEGAADVSRVGVAVSRMAAAPVATRQRGGEMRVLLPLPEDAGVDVRGRGTARVVTPCEF